MLRFRKRSSIRRTGLVIALAYVLALQAMFVAMVGTQHAVAASGSADFAVICFGLGAAPASDDGSAPSRVQQHNCVVCAVACAPASLPNAVAFTLPLAIAVPIAEQTFAGLAGPADNDTPRLSQGPPRAA